MNATPTSRPYPELSVPAIVLGTGLGVLLTASFVYIGLKLGFGVTGSTVAAIVGFTVLRGGMGRRSIVENNINQTVASGINTASAGVTFTLPALFLMSVADPALEAPPIGPLLFSAIAGSLMGIVLIIPLRKQMIELERLRFPSGVAVGTLLRSPGEGRVQGMVLLGGGLLGMVLTVLVNLGFAPEEVDLGHSLGLPLWLPIALYVSSANLGAGLLAGRGGLPYAAGGVLAWWIVVPIAVGAGWLVAPEVVPPTEVDAWMVVEAGQHMLRPLGIGLLIGGALAGVVAAVPAVKGAMRSLAAAAEAARHSGGRSDELPMSVLGVGAVGAFVLLFLAASFSSADLTWFQATMVAVVGSIWLGLAGIIVAQATGHTDISPLSGLSLIAVTLMFFLTAGNVTASILLGVAVCIAINQCADMMADLKTGHLVGSTPRDQQLAQLMLCWLGPLVAIGVIFLLWNLPGDGTPGFGPQSTACLEGAASCLSAPQGDVLAGTIEALRGGDAPVEKYAAGAVLGGALSVFPIGGISVLVGLAMYLPFSITLAYGVGNVVAMGLERRFGPRWVGSRLVPFSAGLIVGEALTQLVWTLYKLATAGGAA